MGGEGKKGGKGWEKENLARIKTFFRRGTWLPLIVKNDTRISVSGEKSRRVCVYVFVRTNSHTATAGCARI